MNAIYFSYGSNMALEQMVARCPKAKLVGPARLPGYRLTFSGFSRAWGGAVATIFPAPGACVPGLLYRISPGDLAQLDAFEGAPHVYERRQHRVRDKADRVLPAEVYGLVQNPFPGVPSAEYFRAIHRAYRKYRFDIQMLSSALAFSGRARH